MDGVLEVASWITLLLGGAFCVVGGIGMWRLPDVFARLHAASLIDSLGIDYGGSYFNSMNDIIFFQKKFC